ncbi:MAG: hypothetical protein ACXAEN_25350, partial [Candidatus Thorarchaeota archaeon]
IKADYPIDIEILQGPAIPSINIDTAQDLYLQGTITSPQNGVITLTADDSVIFGEKAAILGTSPTINAGGSVRANVEGGDTSNGTLQMAGLVQGMQVQDNQQVLNITSDKDIELRVVYDPNGNASSTIIVGQVISTGGNVVLHASGGIQAFDDSSLISGNRIELYGVDENSTIGNADGPLRVDSDVLGDGGVAARAYGDIHIRETEGDLKLIQPQTWENVEASIHSEQGDVYLEVETGDILDAYHEEFAPPSEQEADELDDKMDLTGQAARDAAEESIRIEENTRTGLYHEYWENHRNAQPDSVISENEIESIDSLTDEVRFSQAHGLQTGDQIFFSVGIDLNDENYNYAARWEVINPNYNLETLSLSTLDPQQIVRKADGEFYRYVGTETVDVALSSEDYADTDSWERIDINHDIESLTQEILTPQQIVRKADGEFYRYVGTETVDVALSNEDYTYEDRWEDAVDHDIDQLAGPVTIEPNQIVRTAGDTLYRFVGDNAEDNVDLNSEVFDNNPGRWAQVDPDHDFETLTDVTLDPQQIILTAGDVLYRYVGIETVDVALCSENYNDPKWSEIVTNHDLESLTKIPELQEGQIVETADDLLYRFLGEESENNVALSSEDFDNDTSRWIKIVYDYDLETQSERAAIETGQIVKNTDGLMYTYQDESVKMPDSNLESDFVYYAVVKDDTTIQLAISRYDAAIKETPAILDITIEESVEDVDLSSEDYSDTSRWINVPDAGTVPDYDLDTQTDPVTLQTGQIVKTVNDALYRYLGDFNEIDFLEYSYTYNNYQQDV